ncbi:zinc-type alcohol dehydrogenase-like protein c16a3.02c [Anaeramoeba ignava]|uniref:Zinc-type alcohol dehydrogenase-like protein c16a3.02c n=1 Tax=Anaeramoeba ignava TaxID=1746090 RepID=A0A9Q0LVB5_ANAIG|nr:zinc-type alcohol dehydrogenase-like protein c16a3.02c [Anaeramoeba ignava]
MKALILEKANEKPKVVNDFEKPVPKEDELLVKVHCVALNPVDYKLVSWPQTTWKFPHILGLDVSGVVEEIGEKVKDFQKGDRIYYHGSLFTRGGFAEFAVCKAIVAAKIPEEVTFEEAACLPTAGFTAYICCIKNCVLQNQPEWDNRSNEDETKRKVVLINGAAGGVGGYCLQISKKICNCEVIGTCSPNHADYVRKLGADHVIDYNTEDITKRAKEITKGRGVDAFIDLVGQDSTTEGLNALCFGGKLCYIASPPKALPPMFEAKSVSSCALGWAYTADELALHELGFIAKTMVNWLKEKKISSPDFKTIKLEEIPEYFELFES